MQQRALTDSEAGRLVSLVDAADAPLLARAFYRDGAPSPIVASLAHVPELLEVTVPFLGVVLGPSAIDARLKEIVILRTSARLACRYCVQTHTPVARDAGLERAQVAALRAESPIDGAFADAGERALIAWVDEVASGSGPVDPLLARALAEHFDEAAIAELTLLCGATLMLNRFCSALALPVSPSTRSRLVAEGFA